MKPKNKPYIRLSNRFPGEYVCIGLGATGRGNDQRDAWHAWTIEMTLKGKQNKIQQ